MACCKKNLLFFEYKAATKDGIPPYGLKLILSLYKSIPIIRVFLLDKSLSLGIKNSLI